MCQLPDPPDDPTPEEIEEALATRDFHDDLAFSCDFDDIDHLDRLSNERADALRDDPTLKPDDDADFAAELDD